MSTVFSTIVPLRKSGNFWLLLRLSIAVSFAVLTTACSEPVPDCSGVNENVKALSLTQFDVVLERFVAQNKLDDVAIFGRLKVLSKSSSLSAIRTIKEDAQTGAKFCRAVATFTADVAFVSNETAPGDKFDAVRSGMGALLLIPIIKATSEQSRIPNQMDVTYTIVKVDKGGFYVELFPDRIYGDGIKFRVVEPAVPSTATDIATKSSAPSTTETSAVAAAATSSASQPEIKVIPVPLPPAATASVAEAAPLNPFAPSFDCAKATTGAEKLICANRELSQADVMLSVAFKEALAKSTDVAGLRRSQQDWRKARDTCTEASCMLASYKSRISALN